MSQGKPTVLLAGAVRDAMGVEARPGAVLVRCGKVVAAGGPEVLPPGLLGEAERIDLPERLLLPAMVNAHTHLELTNIGPRPYDPAGGFVGWVRSLRKRLAAITREDLANDQVFPDNQSGWLRAWLRAGAKQGIRSAVDSGIQLVGDICTWQDVQDLMQQDDSGLVGIAHSEVFGLDRNPTSGFPCSAGLYAMGIQPHAPYSAGPQLYAAAARVAVDENRQVCTHLAETLEEHRFVAHGDGPWLDYHQELGTWEDQYTEHYGKGLSPVQWMRPHLEAVADVGGWLVAHCNYVSDDDIAILADTNTSVAYCPVASEYFGHAGHRYRDMLAAGVNVCLGTDSVVCADPGDPQPLGLLGAMRRLYRRDGTDPNTLLAMATVNGASALRMPDTTATLMAGAPARFALIGIDPDHPDDALVQAMTNDQPIEPFDIQ